MAPSLLPQIRVSDIEILGDWDLENVKAFGDSIPGYQMSATFLTTLRSNLHLSACPDSPYSSLVSTPTSSAFSSTTLLTDPTPSPFSISTTAPQATPCHIEEQKSLPSSMNRVAGPEAGNDREAALRLIADSVAEQRQLAAKALVLHPYSVAVIVLLSGSLARYCSLRLLFALSTVILICVMGAVFWMTREYPHLAAAVNWDWLDTSQKTAIGSTNGNCNSAKRSFRCEDPIVVVSRLGDEIIGALVLKVVKKDRKGYVRAWTVDSSHRGKGIGCGLLAEGVRVAWGKGARVMDFDAAHANSHYVLPPTFNGSFLEQEVRRRRLLTDLVAEHRREKSSR